MVGVFLRRDDLLILKYVVDEFLKVVKKVGFENMFVCMKFMVEIINDFKNKKKKV